MSTLMSVEHPEQDAGLLGQMQEQTQDRMRREIEDEVERLGGETLPALFNRAFFELTRDGTRIVFKTFILGREHKEFDETSWAESVGEAVNKMAAGVKDYLNNAGRGGTLYWRAYPELRWEDGKVTARARLEYVI